MLQMLQTDKMKAFVALGTFLSQFSENSSTRKAAVLHNDLFFDAFEDLIYKYYDLVEKYDKCEQALDKACKQLTHAYPFGVNKCETDAWDDSWKEWAFKNDER